MGICEVTGCNKEVWYMYYCGDEIHMVCEYHNIDINKGKEKKLKFKSGYVKRNNYLGKKFITKLK